MNSEEFPTADDKMDYLIFWEIFGMAGLVTIDETKAIGPGSVIMEHSPNWNGKPYGGKWKLWPVNLGGKASGKKKSFTAERRKACMEG